MIGFSLYAKIAAAALIALAIVAFGWHEYHAGSVAGAAAVQQKWDAERAAVSEATTKAVTAAASDALANYHAAGASAQQADDHKAQQAAVHDDFNKRVIDYAGRMQAGNAETGREAGVDGAGKGGAAAGGCAAGIDNDGLRIWNDANAAANGGGAVSASDHSAIAAGPVQ